MKEIIKDLFENIKQKDWKLVKRSFLHLNQYITRGFDDSQTWSLDGTIAKFALPRLKAFKNLNKCHPEEFTFEEWKGIIDDMIYSMEYYSNLDKNMFDSKFDHTRIQKGSKLFGEYFGHLWW